MSISRRSSRVPFDRREQAVERGAIEQPPVSDHGMNAPNVVDVGEWIGIEQHEVSDLSRGTWKRQIGMTHNRDATFTSA